MRLVFVVLLAGCAEPKPGPWTDAPLTHSCTKEQMEKAQVEAEWCNKNTSYFTTYCYGSAIIRNCVPKDGG